MTGSVRPRPWTIRRYDEVTSTMDVAARLIAGGDVDGPTVVVANHQTAGRGRSDRAWHSTPGTALQMTAIMSLPLPISQLGPVPLLVGVAVAEALEAIDPRLDVRLKWPNDVLIGGRKVAGILIVSRSHDEASILQIGLGVNVVADADTNSPAGDLTGVLPSPATQNEIDALRDRLLGEVLSRLNDVPIGIARDAGANGLDRWTRRATLLGEMVTVHDDDRTVEGVLLGVDRRGALLIETEIGNVVPVVAGDLTRGPRLRTDDRTRDR